MADAPLSSNEVADSRKPSCRHQSEVWMGDCDLCQKDCHVEIERLTASLAEANASANHLTAERDRLRAALKEYGIHLQPECSDGCVCGLDKLVSGVTNETAVPNYKVDPYKNPLPDLQATLCDTQFGPDGVCAKCGVRRDDSE